MQERKPRRKLAPIIWLKAPNDRDRVSLSEFTRGTFASLSIDEAGQFQHVHVNALKRAFERLGAPSLCKVGLRLAHLLGEIERTSGGYWAPTPYRVIELGNRSAFIGVASGTDETFGDFENEGLCRLVETNWREDVPRQTLDSWMGAAPRNWVNAIENLKAWHVRQELPVSSLVGVTYLTLVADPATRRARALWLERPAALFPDNGIAICKQQLRGSERYFSARLRAGRITTESPLSLPVSVLRYAIHSHAGKPITAVIEQIPAGTALTISEPLPLAEFRLALLLSREIRRRGRSTTFVLSPELAGTLSTKLELLGCSLEIKQ